MKQPKTLIIGIGNSGRQDDGLGWAFLDQIELYLDESFNIEYRYQLQVEDAELISHFGKVIFVDADLVHYLNGYNYSKLIPKDVQSYTSHELNPESVLQLSQTIYKNAPEAFLLGISGEKFHLEIGLTDFAHLNLKNAVKFFIAEYLKIVTTICKFN